MPSVTLYLPTVAGNVPVSFALAVVSGATAYSKVSAALSGLPTSTFAIIANNAVLENDDYLDASVTPHMTAVPRGEMNKADFDAAARRYSTMAAGGRKQRRTSQNRRGARSRTPGRKFK